MDEADWLDDEVPMKVSRARLTVHGIPARFHNVTLDDFKGNADAVDEVRNYIAHLERNRKAGTGLVLYGPNGTGKTVLAVCILKAALEAGMIGHLYPWPSLLQARTAGWRDIDQQMEFGQDVFRSDFLVIDDLGKELAAGKELSVSTLDLVIRGRSNHFRPTIITTNADPKAIRQVYGDSIASLLNGCMVPLLVDGEDMRGTA